MTDDQIAYILWGALTTVNYSLVAVFFGFIISLPIALMRISKYKILQLISILYISVIRGTPLLLQLSLWYFAFPQVIGWKLSAFAAGSITFSINSSAYLAEVIRSGITAVDIGQMEAAKVMGLTKKDTLFDIILPQAVSNISPAIINEIVSLTKETAIIGFIGIADLTRRAQLVSAETYDFFGPMIAAGLGYYCLTIGIGGIYTILSRRKNIVDNLQPPINTTSEDGK
jgi:polar amino acid transport system permease protein